MSAVDIYVQLAESWGRAMEEGDSDAANSLHERIQKVFQEICDLQQKAALFDRADSASDAVCFFITSHLRERDPERALRLYQRLNLSVLPFVSLSTHCILNEMERELKPGKKKRRA